MGGGTILVLVLSNFLRIDQHVAQATNLIYFIPTSLAAIWVYFKNKSLDMKIVWKMLPVAIIGGVIGSYIATLIQAKNLKRYFGIFLLALGVYEMVITVKNKIKEKKKKQNTNESDLNTRRIKGIQLKNIKSLLRKKKSSE